MGANRRTAQLQAFPTQLAVVATHAKFPPFFRTVAHSFTHAHTATIRIVLSCSHTRSLLALALVRSLALTLTPHDTASSRMSQRHRR